MVGVAIYTSCILAYTKTADCFRARKVCFFAELCAKKMQLAIVYLHEGGYRRMADQENSGNKAWLVLLHTNCKKYVYIISVHGAGL